MKIKRDFKAERTVLDIPGGGQAHVGITKDGQIKLSIRNAPAYHLESFFRGARVDLGGNTIAILVPDRRH